MFFVTQPLRLQGNLKRGQIRPLPLGRVSNGGLRARHAVAAEVVAIRDKREETGLAKESRTAVVVIWRGADEEDR